LLGELILPRPAQRRVAALYLFPRRNGHQPRLSYEDFTKAAPGAYAGLAALSKAVDESGLEKSLTELVNCAPRR